MSAPKDPLTPPASLILSRSEIVSLMRRADWLAAAEAGFQAAGEKRVEAPPPLAIHGANGAFHAKAAGLRGERHFVALKLNGNFPGNPDRLGLPTIQGAILLCDGASGAVLAIMDSIEVTLRRTAAATALAARFLARPDSATVLICGCGAQVIAQLDALRDILPIRRCLAWDRDLERASDFAGFASAEGLDAAVSTDLAADARASDIIVTCTTSRRPFLDPDIVGPGTFVAAVGADSAGKSEIAPALMANAKVVADSVDQCAAMGDLRHAIAARAMTREAVHAELAEILCGARTGRETPGEVTIFDSTGSGLQDVAAAIAVYEQAVLNGHSRTVALAA